MTFATTLTGMQRHVLENLADVEKHSSKSDGVKYDLRGKEVSAHITSLVAKGLVTQTRSGEISRRDLAS